MNGHLGHLEREQPYLGDLRSPGLLTRYPSVHPPSMRFAGYEPEGIVPNRSKSFRSQQLEILQLANSGWIIFISYQTLLGGASHLATTQQLWLTVVPLRMGLWQTPYLIGRTSWLTKWGVILTTYPSPGSPSPQVYTANHQGFGRCLAAARMLWRAS